MYLKHLKFFVISAMIISNHANADLLSSFKLPEKPILEFLENGPSWMPKPYKIPFDQGHLIEKNKIEQLRAGLTKEQIIFLLGTPSITDVFHQDRWDYVYFDRVKGKFSEPKTLTIFFANEIVREIYSQDVLIAKKDKELDLESLNTTPSRNTDTSEIVETEIIISRREDFLTARVDKNLPVCIDDEFESYQNQKTLVQADDDTLEVRSDEQNQDEDGIFFASGNVEIERANDLVKSDRAQFNADTGVLQTEGNVKYLTEDLTLYAEEGGYNSQNDTVSFSDTTYYFPGQDQPGKGKAKDLFIDDEGLIYLTPSSYTTCSINYPDWELSSSKTILYRDDDRGHAYNIFLKYKNIPVLYSPFISFPLSKERHSGFLLPSIGSSGESGSVISIPYYFNLAENFDMTLTPTNFSGRGLMIEGEFRHKSKRTSTEFEFANLDKDDVYGKNRHAYFLRDNRIFSDNLKRDGDRWLGTQMSSSINIGGISDLNYFDDFGNTVSRVGRTHITRNINFNRIDYTKYGSMSTSIGATDFQLAKTDLTEQYSVLPRIKFNYTSPRMNNSLNYHFNSEVAVFDHTYPTKVTGTRSVFYPSLSYPISKSGWEMVSKVGIKHRDYRLSLNSSGKTRKEISSTTPIISMRGRLIFEKITQNNLLQTLEPEAYFLYVPASNQDDIPIFDSGDVDFKYNLFSENKFYGHDRLNDAKQMTLALSSSLISTNTGNEYLRGTIGQIFYFDDRSVHLNNSNTVHSDSSNLMGLVNAKFGDYWRMSAYAEYDPHNNYGEKNQIRFSYKRPYGKQNKIFNTSYRFARGTQEEIDVSGVLPINSRTSLIGKINYSFNNRRSNSEDVLERMIGVEYESCCYGIKFVLREYWNGTKSDDVVYFEFLPKGIATSNNTTAELLREGILGYQDKFDY